MDTEPNESPTEDVFEALEQLPFVKGIKRDVQTLSGLIRRKRVPRIAVIGGSAAGKTGLLTMLLGEQDLPTETIALSRWNEVEVRGRRIDWFEHDLSSVAPIPTERLRANKPDVLLICIDGQETDEVEAAAPAIKEAIDRAKLKALPRIAVITHTDQVAPSGSEFPEDKRIAIDVIRQRVSKAFREAGLELKQTVGVASDDGEILFGSEELATHVFEALPDEAQLEAARSFAAAKAPRMKVAKRLVDACAALSITVGLAPVPFSDVVIIGPLQATMISAIAYVSGRPWSMRAGSELLASLGMVGAASFGLRWSARQLVKLMPGAGTLVSAGVAGVGTTTLGRAAIAYFFAGQHKALPQGDE